MDNRKLAWLAPPLVAAAVALWLAPSLVHDCDPGKATVTIAEVAAGQRPTTRNWILAGKAAVDQGMSVDMRRVDTNISTGVAWVLVPIVPNDWKPTDPVHVVYRARYGEDLGREPAHAGVVRDVLWEGMGDKERKSLQDDLHLALAPDVVLLDAQADDWSLNTCVVFIIGALVVAALAVWNALRNAASAARV